jgi:hypothetical protein
VPGWARAVRRKIVAWFRADEDWRDKDHTTVVQPRPAVPDPWDAQELLVKAPADLPDNEEAGSLDHPAVIPNLQSRCGPQHAHLSDDERSGPGSDPVSWQQLPVSLAEDLFDHGAAGPACAAQEMNKVHKTGATAADRRNEASEDHWSSTKAREEWNTDEKEVPLLDDADEEEVADGWDFPTDAAGLPADDAWSADTSSGRGSDLGNAFFDDEEVDADIADYDASAHRDPWKVADEAASARAPRALRNAELLCRRLDFDSRREEQLFQDELAAFFELKPFSHANSESPRPLHRPRL